MAALEQVRKRPDLQRPSASTGPISGILMNSHLRLVVFWPVFLTYYCSGQAAPAVPISVAALVARLARYIQNGRESMNPETVARRESSKA